MAPIEENTIPFTNLVDYCMDLCKEFHSKYSKAYRQRIAGLNLSEYDTFQCWYCGEVINPNGEKTKHCPVCGKSLKFPIAKVVKEVFLASIRSKFNFSNYIT